MPEKTETKGAMPPGVSTMTHSPTPHSSASLADKIHRDAKNRLARKPWTVRKMRAALLKRWRDEAVVEQVVANLDRAGLLDDEALARTAAAHELERAPIGADAMIGKLVRAGVDEPLARRVVDELFADRDVFDDAMTLAQRNVKSMPASLPCATRVRRLAANLARRGFDQETIAAVITDLFPDD